MGFSGYLIKLGGSNGVVLPMKYIKLEGYKITPDQRLESEAKRATTGILKRTTVSHTATKIEFTTPHLTNDDVSTLNGLIGAAFTSVLERKLDLEYYDMEQDTYNHGTFYMPDTDYTIDHIDMTTNTVYYKEFTMAFIEY